MNIIRESWTIKSIHQVILKKIFLKIIRCREKEKWWNFNEGFYVPEGEDSFLGEPSQASSDSKYEGEDSEGRVHRHQWGTEASCAFIADQQQQEAEEADSVLKNN